MGNWNQPGYWRWWWTFRAAPEAKMLIVLTPVLVLAGLGFILAGQLPTDVEAAARPQTITIERVVTSRGTVKVRVVTHPGKVVTRAVPAALPKPKAVTESRVVTETRVLTQARERVVTNERVVTERVTVPVTVARTVTKQVPTTRTLTVTRTRTTTVTLPAVTESVTVTVVCPPKGCKG